MKEEFDVITKYSPDGVIEQEIFSAHNGIREQIMRRVVDTEDQQIRAALIALGWTPPKP